MLRMLIGFLGTIWILTPSLALAVPIVDKSQAVAGPRSDPGTGICGSVAHFAPPGMPLSSKADAVAILNKPATDPVIFGHTSRLFDNINFSNTRPGSDGDFKLPDFRKGVFPYSLDPMATPMGVGTNFAVRLRGYLNVAPSLSGKTISFGLNCDDFCSLTIGRTEVISAADSRVSSRIIKQVSFADAGLYPVEIVYYQNDGPAYLEWSRTEVAVPECPSDFCTIPLTDPISYMGQFKLVPAAELYSAIVGSSPSCEECGAPGMTCPTGQFCGDGLCQACGAPDHCGPFCARCPADRPVCLAGSCIPFKF